MLPNLDLYRNFNATISQPLIVGHGSIRVVSGFQKAYFMVSEDFPCTPVITFESVEYANQIIISNALHFPNAQVA